MQGGTTVFQPVLLLMLRVLQNTASLLPSVDSCYRAHYVQGFN